MPAPPLPPCQRDAIPGSAVGRLLRFHKHSLLQSAALWSSILDKLEMALETALRHSKGVGVSKELLKGSTASPHGEICIMTTQAHSRGFALHHAAQVPRLPVKPQESRWLREQT